MPKKETRYEKVKAENAARRRVIIRMYMIDGMTKSEIARVIGMSRSRVGTIIKEYCKVDEVGA